MQPLPRQPQRAAAMITPIQRRKSREETNRRRVLLQQGHLACIVPKALSSAQLQRAKRRPPRTTALGRRRRASRARLEVRPCCGHLRTGMRLSLLILEQQASVISSSHIIPAAQQAMAAGARSATSRGPSIETPGWHSYAPRSGSLGAFPSTVMRIQVSQQLAVDPHLTALH